MNIFNQKALTSQNKYLKKNLFEWETVLFTPENNIVMDVIVTETLGRVEKKILMTSSG